MDIQPTIIGPEIGISPDIVLNPFENTGFPVPGIPITSKGVWLLLTEDQSVGLSLNYCRNLKLKGLTGKEKAFINSNIESSVIHVNGFFGSLDGDYYISKIEDGYALRGRAGRSNFNLKVNFIENLPKIYGTINSKSVDIVGSYLTDTIMEIRGNVGKDRMDVQVVFSIEDQIQVRGKNRDKNVDYTVRSLGDRIVIEGMTIFDYTKLSYILTDENEFHVVGNPRKVPVDYNLTLYENGVAIDGNTGYYKANYALVVGIEE